MRYSLFGLLLSLPLTTQAAPLRVAEITIGTDDNIAAARDTQPRATEQFLQIGAGLGWARPLADNLTLRLNARADGRLHARYDGLNEIAATGEGQLLLRPGKGFYTPVIGVALGVSGSAFNSALRDGQELRLRLFAREALTTRLSARGSVLALRRESDGEAFDAKLRAIEAALDWQAAERLTLSLGYQYRDGDVVSIGTPRGAALVNASAVQPDDVFAGASAFRFDAQTHIGLIGVNYALSPRLALDSQLRYIESDPRFDSRYHRWTTLTGLLFRF